MGSSNNSDPTYSTTRRRSTNSKRQNVIITFFDKLKKEKAFLEPFIKAHAFALTNYLVYAIHEIEKALKVNSNNIQAFLLRGKILWALNKVPEGNLDYWRAHSLNPDH